MRCRRGGVVMCRCGKERARQEEGEERQGEQCWVVSEDLLFGWGVYLFRDVSEITAASTDV